MAGRTPPRRRCQRTCTVRSHRLHLRTCHGHCTPRRWWCRGIGGSSPRRTRLGCMCSCPCRRPLGRRCRVPRTHCPSPRGSPSHSCAPRYRRRTHTSRRCTSRPGMCPVRCTVGTAVYSPGNTIHPGRQCTPCRSRTHSQPPQSKCTVHCPLARCRTGHGRCREWLHHPRTHHRNRHRSSRRHRCTSRSLLCRRSRCRVPSKGSPHRRRTRSRNQHPSSHTRRCTPPSHWCHQCTCRVWSRLLIRLAKSPGMPLSNRAGSSGPRRCSRQNRHTFRARSMCLDQDIGWCTPWPASPNRMCSSRCQWPHGSTARGQSRFQPHC